MYLPKNYNVICPYVDKFWSPPPLMAQTKHAQHTFFCMTLVNAALLLLLLVFPEENEDNDNGIMYLPGHTGHQARVPVNEGVSICVSIFFAVYNS